MNADISRTALAGSSMDMLQGIKVISFDLDDTLWHCEPVILAAEQALFSWMEERTPRVTAQHDAASLHAHRLALIRIKPLLLHDVTELRLQSLRKLFIEHDYPSSHALAGQAFAEFYRARSQVTLYDGVEALLAMLGRRFHLAAITNGNADLEQIGIAHHFSSIQRATVLCPPKPNPEMFHRCLQAFGAEPQTLLHIGDNPATDVEGGHAAGVRTLWFNQHGELWPEPLTRPHFEVDSITSLGRLFDPEFTGAQIP